MAFIDVDYATGADHRGGEFRAILNMVHMCGGHSERGGDARQIHRITPGDCENTEGRGEFSDPQKCGIGRLDCPRRHRQHQIVDPGRRRYQCDRAGQ